MSKRFNRSLSRRSPEHRRVLDGRPAAAHAVILASSLFLGSCGAGDPREGSSSPDSTASAGAATLGGDSPLGDSAWVLTATSLGPIRFGMTLAEARAALPEGAWTQPTDTLFCDYAGVRGAPEETGFMTDGGRVMRGEVRAGSTTTAEGAKIGDPEERIRSLYGGRLQEWPHKYVEGKYMVVTPNPADTLSRIIFETDGAKVTRFYGGLMPNVSYVEGCS